MIFFRHSDPFAPALYWKNAIVAKPDTDDIALHAAQANYYAFFLCADSRLDIRVPPIDFPAPPLLRFVTSKCISLPTLTFACLGVNWTLIVLGIATHPRGCWRQANAIANLRYPATLCEMSNALSMIQEAPDRTESTLQIAYDATR
jgi:hypothetical protein